VTAARYRKKPVEVEAMRFQDFGTIRSGEIADWCGGHYDNAGDGRPGWIEIDTLEGVMRANSGDWIIRGVQGEFYPCKPDIFDATYERVS
jgi:hypothetical protein